MSDASGPVPAYLRPDEPVACPCGRAPQQPWRTRDATYSPASFISGLFWVALGAGSAIGGFAVFGAALLGVLLGFAVGAAVVQGRRGHRGWCLVRRAAWFGIAVPGLPLRVLVSFGF
ncbi:hypothetical protein E1263_34430 [Kribbella antibiotica]|uniref:Uncharacterized protein n=1 Tax=Kribbella antibiotica TaxID=190195 RepID=A0A4R4YQS5_9ACTN|nr:hypothetical protein [Kribbella antibiotica]TDD47503.1 hypothetical protein E1263_34430 [Kribbella antibiotica]